MMRTVVAPTVLVALVCYSLSGCATLKLGDDGGGKLTLQSHSEKDLVLKGGFDTGIYCADDKNHLIVVLFDGPVDRPTQVLTIRMFWKPRPGRTPIDHTATNASIHYVIFAGEDREEVGIYSGAGFVYPNSQPGRKTLRAGVWQANLRLADASDGFADLLGQSVLKGRFTAQLDELSVDQVLHRINVHIQQRLGYPRSVRVAPNILHRSDREPIHGRRAS